MDYLQKIGRSNIEVKILILWYYTRPPKVREKEKHCMQSKLCIFNPPGDPQVTLGITFLLKPPKFHVQNLPWI